MATESNDGKKNPSKVPEKTARHTEKNVSKTSAEITQQKIDKRREEARRRQKKNQKLDNSRFSRRARTITLSIVCAVAAAVVVFCIVFPNTGWSRRVMTALTIGDNKVSVAEYSYYYRSAFSTYYNTMVTYLGSDNVPIDTSTPLDQQQYSEDQTYADYFSENAISTLQQIYTLASEAEKAGYELSDSAKSQVESDIESISSSADSYGVSLQSYLTSVYGMGINEDLLRKILTREQLASEYAAEKENSFTYTDEEIEAYYEENEQDYLTADVRFVRFATSEATDTTEAVTAEQAKANAEAFMEGVTTEEEFIQAAAEKAAEEEAASASEDSTATDSSSSDTSSSDSSSSDTSSSDESSSESSSEDSSSSESSSAESSTSDTSTSEDTSSEDSSSSDSSSTTEDTDTTLYSGMTYSELESASQNLADWVFNEGNEAGACGVVENDDATAYYAVYLVKAPSRDESKTVNVRHILISVSDTTDESETAQAQAKAQEIYQEFQDNGGTEEEFAALAEEYSDDTGSASNGGLYENVTEGQMVTEFNDWCFDPSRQPGDSEIIMTSYGFHIMYFVGEGKTAWMTEVESDMRSSDYSDWYTAAEESYPVKEHRFWMRYRSEPI